MDNQRLLYGSASLQVGNAGISIVHPVSYVTPKRCRAQAPALRHPFRRCGEDAQKEEAGVEEARGIASLLEGSGTNRKDGIYDITLYT